MESQSELMSLFLRYLNICNLALREHREQFPYKQIVELGERALGGRNIGVGIYEEDPETIIEYCTVRFSDGTFDVVEHGEKNVELEWTVKRTYMEHVANHSDQYIDAPEKLEWDWLKSRLGIGEEYPEH